MKKHNSCEKLIGLEEGVLWSPEAKNEKSIAVWKREENLTRCMKLLFACLAVVLLVLIFYHFRLSLMERTNTQNTIGSLEGMQAEKDSLTPNIFTIYTKGIDDKVSDEENDSSVKWLPFSVSDHIPPTSWSPLPTLPANKDNETNKSSNGIEDEESEVPNPVDEKENTNRLFGWISFIWGWNNDNQETESEITTTKNVLNVEEKDNREETQPEIMIDHVSENVSETESEITTTKNVLNVEEKDNREETQREIMIDHVSENVSETESEITTTKNVLNVEEKDNREETQRDIMIDHVSENVSETESEITTTENVLNVEEKDNREETQHEIMIDHFWENGYDYSADPSYDYISEEESEYDDSTMRIPVVYPTVSEKSEVPRNISDDGEDDLPNLFPLTGWLFTFNWTFGDENDINELGTTERISDRSSKQDDDVDNLLQISEKIDEIFREFEAERLALINSTPEHEDDPFAGTEYDSIPAEKDSLTPNIFTIYTKGIDDKVSDEDNDSSVKSIPFSVSDHIPPTSWSPLPTLPANEDHETNKSSDGIDDEESEVPNPVDEKENANRLFGGISFIWGWNNDDQETESEITTTENVLNVEEKDKREETQREIMIDHVSENGYDYSADPFYDYISEEESEYDDSTMRIPMVYPTVSEKSEVPRNISDDGEDDLPNLFPLTGWLFTFNRTFGNENDINELGTTERISDGSLKQNDDVDNVLQISENIDEVFRKFEAESPPLINSTPEHEDDPFAGTEYDGIYPDWWGEGEFDEEPISELEKAMSQDYPSQDSSILEPIQFRPFYIHYAASSSKSSEDTNADVDDEYTRLLCQSFNDSTSEDLYLLNVLLGVPPKSGKFDLEKCLSLRKENLTIIESSTTPSDNENSQQVDTVRQNFESSTESSGDSDETIESLGYTDMPWINDLTREMCKLLYDFTSEDVYLLSDVLSEAEIDTTRRCLSLKEEDSNKSLENSSMSKRSITDESVREEIGDHQSTSKPEQILAIIQKVVQQDRKILTDEASRISNPVVKSKIEDFYEKMETVAAHINQLHELYLEKNKLEDDYVSREFPPQA